MGYDPYKANSEKKGKGGSFLAFDWKGKKVDFWKPKSAGDYRIDIIPYKIASKNHPDVRRGASIGQEVYSLDFYTHGYVGPGQVTVICPKETYKKACPICEQAEIALREHGKDSKEYVNLKVKHRVLYNVVNPDDENEKIMLFEETFAFFEQELNKFAGNRGRRMGKDFVHFGDVSEGLTVAFTAEENKFNGKAFFKYNSWDFEERDRPHNKSIIDAAYALDDYLVVKSYDELKEILYGDNTAEEDEPADAPEEKPAKEPEKAEAPKKKCPKGRVFGKDYDRAADECDACDDIWRECRALTKEGA